MADNSADAVKAIKSDLMDGGFFRDWMPRMQRRVLFSNLDGEEGGFFVEMLTKLKERIQTMPKTYEQDGLGVNAVASLHYFRGGVDAWITEKDAGDGSGDSRQIQAFGFITLTGEKEDGELGYIAIEELIGAGVELDLYWDPKTLKEITGRAE